MRACCFVKRFLIGFKKFFYFFLNIPENGQEVKRTAGERAAFAAVFLPNIEKKGIQKSRRPFGRGCRRFRVRNYDVTPPSISIIERDTSPPPRFSIRPTIRHVFVTALSTTAARFYHGARSGGNYCTDCTNRAFFRTIPRML